MCRVPMGHTNTWEELVRVLSSLDLPHVLLHSTRTLGMTHGAQSGIDVASLRDGDGWRGPSMLSYIRDEHPLKRIQEALYEGFSTAASGK